MSAMSLIAMPAYSRAAAPIDRVDPFIGTDAHGHVFPGATVPFGMVQLSPDTRLDTWDGCSGYHYSDSTITGFSHNHLSGTGCGDLGNISFLPVLAETSSDPITAKPANFSHDHESAKPGLYQVDLSDSQIHVDLTATARAGFQRYRFPKSEMSRHVLLDLSHGVGNEMTEASYEVVSDHELQGFRRSAGWGGNKVFYFDAQFSKPFGPIRSHTAMTKQEDKSLKASYTCDLNFAGTGDEPLLVKVGLSTVNAAGAKANLEAEIPAWDFDGTVAAAEKLWSEALSKATIETDDEHLQRTFYTAMYHALIAPNLLSDIDGQYRGPDMKVHKASGSAFYTTLSLWDTFRAEHPLLTLVEPDRVAPLVHTLLDHAADIDHHTLPVWTDGGKENWCMIGNHAIPVITDAYEKGMRDFDANAALDAMVHSQETKKYSSDPEDLYLKFGYVPSDPKLDRQSVSRTLELAYDDACIARMARRMHRDDIAEKYSKRAENWRNVFDSQTNLMRGKLEDGKFVEPFDPLKIDFHDYTEANAWQYSFFVPQNVAGLAEAMGGDEKFVDQLDRMFDSKDKPEGDQSDVSGLIGQFAQGNEPSHHMPYLYSFAGRPDQTAKRVRQVAALYTDGHDGLCGNDDCGQMSAWYVFSALGFYPVDPASGVYVIGSPLAQSASLRLPNNKTFTVVAEHNSEKNLFIQSAMLNGKPFDHSWISHEQILAGGELKLVMGASPSKWGEAKEARPPQVAPEYLPTAGQAGGQAAGQASADR